MKQLILAVVILTFTHLNAFAEAARLNEIDFLLFAPNSSLHFVNDQQASNQLDRLAEYLLSRELFAGQIHIYGYAATAKDDIDPMIISKERALFVKNELVRRGLQDLLFSEVAALGEVSFWGSNATEEERIPNRRVRVFLANHPYPVGGIASIEQQNEERILASAGNNYFRDIIFLLLALLILGVLLIIILLALKRKAKTENSFVLNDSSPNSDSDLDEMQVNDVLFNEDLFDIGELIPNVTNDHNIHQKTQSDLGNTIRDIILKVPVGTYFDVHTIVEKLLQKHDEVYLGNVGHYTSAAQYHSRISRIISHEEDIACRAGNSYSKNIHDKFSECHLFMRVAQ